jgi:putative sigma-54 modulation protein
MIEAIAITGVKYDLDDTTKKYVTKKIGRLDRYLPKHARKSVSADVKLKEVNRDHGNKYEAEISLSVPGHTVTATDSTVNMLAAIDIVEAKLIAQLRKYKQATIPYIGRRGVLSRFKRSYEREQQDVS